nr:unnamed protein product [Callosobruchus analis]
MKGYLSQGPSMDIPYRDSTIHYIIHGTCKALWDVLALEYLETPKKWEEISRGFQERWNFSHCLGSIDGKHVSIQAPPGSGSLFYNYKKHFSIALLGACDAYYKYTYVDIGAYGSQSDGGVLKNTIVTLHNYCQTELAGPGNDIYCPPNFVDREGEENGGWRAEQESLLSVDRLGANVAKRFVYDIRNTLAHYFLSDEGKVLAITAHL